MSSPASFRSWENLVYHVISPISATRMAASVPPTPVMGDVGTLVTFCPSRGKES